MTEPTGSVDPAAPPGPAAGDLPEAALRRLQSDAFSSGLTVPDFAACLELGLEPVALVQGFCVMQWGWYGPGSGYMRGMSPYAFASGGGGGYSETYRCPHGYVSAEHRTWGQNLEQPWVEEAWAGGYGAAYAAHDGGGDRSRRARGDRRRRSRRQHRRHRDDRIPLPRHGGHGRRRAAARRRGALEHVPCRPAPDKIHRGRLHACSRSWPRSPRSGCGPTA